MKRMNLFIILLSLAMSACSKGGGDNGGDNSTTLPTLKLTDVTQSRNTSDITFRFFVSVSPSTFTKPITITYTTQEGTAKANKDFVPANGTLTIQPGSNKGYVDVMVKGDSLRQGDLQFALQFSDAQNGTLAATKATGTIQNADGTYLPTDNDGYSTPNNYAGYTLAWSDEFSASNLDMTSWNTETGGSGWGNHELEYYTGRPQNVFLSKGNLIIEARKEAYSGNNYTSARLTTQGKKEYQFGRIDVRAKLPVKKGMWPAIWALGKNITTTPWPACGEIDIMELVGQTPKQAFGTMHWGAAGGGSTHIGGSTTLASGDFSEKFHVFSMVWEQDSLQWLVDDVPFFKGTKADLKGADYPFNKPFFFLLNVAVGGDWPGSPDDSTPFPQRMFVDYVRVFQKQ